MREIQTKQQILLIFGLLFTFFTNRPAFAQDENIALKQLQALRAAANQKSQDSLFQSQLQQLTNPTLPTSGASAEAGQEGAVASEADRRRAAELEFERQEKLEDAVAENNFQSLLKQMMPLSPSQIRRLRKKQDEIDLASKGPVGMPPKPVAISHFVSLAPGDKLPIIRMQQGFVSSLVFVDSTGAPWPIEMYSLGDPALFNVSWDKKGNILLVQANEKFDYGNLAVKLKGQNTPVMLTLVPGQQEVDYRVDLRVQGLGPNAIPYQLSDGLPPKTNDLLMSILDGVPPKGSTELHVNGGRAIAWVYNQKLYLRTRLTLISPGWLTSMSSPDGMNVYELLKTPMLLVSDHGQIVQLKLEGM